MSRSLRRIFALIASVSFVVLIIMLFIWLTPEPPSGQMEAARKAISDAVSGGADTYSRKLYNQALAYYDSAMVNWKSQNNKFFLKRNYEKVSFYANLSVQRAVEAGTQSRTSTSELNLKLRGKIESLKNLASELDSIFNSYPLTEETRIRISRGMMLLEEADIAYKKGKYFQANRKITDSEYLLTESLKNATENLKNYFKSYNQWKKWVDLTVNESRKNNDYSIIIDKFSRKCYVYYSGRKKYEFDAELGKNWVGLKRVKGDMATPEGMYKITQKFDSRKTRFYKALLLNYPNEEDTARFKAEKQNGSLPPDAKIGGLIEIHGNGGKGIDWTEGCVALTDREMDLIYKIARVGTPVTIVGSMVELDTIVK